MTHPTKALHGFTIAAFVALTCSAGNPQPSTELPAQIFAEPAIADTAEAKAEAIRCYRIASKLVQSGDTTGAFEWCRKAISLDSSFASAYFLHGQLLGTQGEWKEAIENYEKALMIGLDEETENAALKVIRALKLAAAQKLSSFGRATLADVLKPAVIEEEMIEKGSRESARKNGRTWSKSESRSVTQVTQLELQGNVLSFVVTTRYGYSHQFRSEEQDTKTDKQSLLIDEVSIDLSKVHQAKVGYKGMENKRVAMVLSPGGLASGIVVLRREGHFEANDVYYRKRHDSKRESFFRRGKGDPKSWVPENFSLDAELKTQKRETIRPSSYSIAVKNDNELPSSAVEALNALIHCAKGETR